MEKLIAELVESKDIGKGVFTVLWEFFTGVLPGSTTEDAHPAIMLIRMCACSEVNIISSNLQVNIDYLVSKIIFPDKGGNKKLSLFSFFSSVNYFPSVSGKKE